MPFDKRKGFVAILDTMWGSKGQAPEWFLINPDNASGRRLYKLTESHYGNLAVVNACPEQTNSATERGIPDEAWLLHSLDSLPHHYTRRGVPLLVCGKVAQKTFDACNIKWNGPVIYMDHPAARNWTKAKLEKTRRQIQRATPARWRA